MLALRCLSLMFEEISRILIEWGLPHFQDPECGLVRGAAWEPSPASGRQSSGADAAMGTDGTGAAHWKHSHKRARAIWGT